MLLTSSGAVLQMYAAPAMCVNIAGLSQRLTKVDKGLITGISEVSTEPRPLILQVWSS